MSRLCAYDFCILFVKVCGKKTRVAPSEFASRKCSEYAALLPALDPLAGGLQAPHDPSEYNSL